MGYLYDFHVHSNECSMCAHSSIFEVIKALKEAGYAGMVLTNHFLTSYHAVSDDLAWEDKIKFYWQPFLDGKKLADELDFDFHFGVEYHYGNAQEILMYGIDYDFLVANSDMLDIPVEELSDRVRAYGGYVSHSHPFRVRAYIPEGVPEGKYRMDISHVDAIEVINSANREIDDQLALEYAQSLDLGMTAGNDLHDVNHLKIFPRSGLIFDRRLKTRDELITALKTRAGKLFTEGERYYK